MIIEQKNPADLKILAQGKLVYHSYIIINRGSCVRLVTFPQIRGVELRSSQPNPQDHEQWNKVQFP